MKDNPRLIKLPKKGRLLIFTDVHGNLEDYNKYLDKWDSNDPDCHIIIAGDFIHNILSEDYSVEVLEDIIEKFKKYDNFHPILGNHEWIHIIDGNIFKGNVNLRLSFERLILTRKVSLEPYLTNYINFFRTIPLCVQSESGIFVSHSGPSRRFKSRKDFESLIGDEDYYSELMLGFLWSRPGADYDEKDVCDFLDIVKSNVMVVGHTVVDGYCIFGKQMILSSSFGSEKKLYLDIDLSQPINDMDDLTANLKNLDED